MSDWIRVNSILGPSSTRWIYRFGDGEDDEIWIGSPDMMHRNLDRRGRGPRARRRSRAPRAASGALERAVADPTAWNLRADGTRARRRGDSGLTLQRTLMRRAALGMTDP